MRLKLPELQAKWQLTNLGLRQVETVFCNLIYLFIHFSFSKPAPCGTRVTWSSTSSCTTTRSSSTAPRPAATVPSGRRMPFLELAGVESSRRGFCHEFITNNRRGICEHGTYSLVPKKRVILLAQVCPSSRSAIAAMSLPYWRRWLSRDYISALSARHGTACGASMAMNAYGRLIARDGSSLRSRPQF